MKPCRTKKPPQFKSEEKISRVESGDMNIIIDITISLTNQVLELNYAVK